MSRESKRLKAAARHAKWRARIHAAGFKVPQQRTEGTLAAENIRACQVFAALPPEQKPEKTQPIARDFAPLPLSTPLELPPAIDHGRNRHYRGRRLAIRARLLPNSEPVTTGPNRTAIPQRVL